jgi:GxxExxY protein
MIDLDMLSGEVLDICIRMHRVLGSGLLESVYEQVLASKLKDRGYLVECQKPLAIEFEGDRFEGAFRIDMVVERRLLIEIKSVERLLPVHSKQLLTYLKLSSQPLGLLINFGGPTLIEGYKRLVNDHTPSAFSAFSARDKKKVSE